MKIIKENEKIIIDLEGLKINVADEDLPLSSNFFKTEGIDPENVTVTNGVFDFNGTTNPAILQ